MEILPSSSEFYFYLTKFKSILQYQYHIPNDQITFFDESKLTFILSKRTNRLKYIKYRDEIISTFRYHDGFLVFTDKGASILLKNIKYPRLRVVVPDDIAEFISKGYNLFSKHVVDIDPLIRPESEIFVVNTQDEFIAVGKLIMNKRDLECFKTGVAVKIR